VTWLEHNIQPVKIAHKLIKNPMLSSHMLLGIAAFFIIESGEEEDLRN
jgi:hypothetical protein